MPGGGPVRSGPPSVHNAYSSALPAYNTLAYERRYCSTRARLGILSPMESTDQAPAPAARPRPSCAPLREFAMHFTSTPRGARLARRLVSHRLDEWGHPYDSAVNETVTLIAAELTANAVRHGHVPGRDFALRLTAAAEPAVLCVEVSDTRTERVPAPSAVEPPADEERGRGLLLVAGLAARWGVSARTGAPGKTVWAEVPRDQGADRAASASRPFYMT